MYDSIQLLIGLWFIVSVMATLMVLEEIDEKGEE